MLLRSSSCIIRTMSTTSCVNSVLSMNVNRLSDIIKNNELSKYQLVDCREAHEIQMASLKVPNIIHLPLSNFQSWSNEVTDGLILNPDVPTMVLCKVGVRSLKVSTFLVNAGIKEVYNIEGGIDAYARTIDSSVGTY